MRVRDRHRQRVGGVRAGNFNAGEQALDHRVDLRLFGRAGADHRLLDQPRRIFADFDPGAGSDHQCDTARLAELERRLRVLVDEYFLDRSGLRRMIGDDRFKLRREVGKALSQRFGRASFELSVGEMGQSVTLGADQPPAGRAEPGIEAEDDQPSFSSSSSGTL